MPDCDHRVRALPGLPRRVREVGQPRIQTPRARDLCEWARDWNRAWCLACSGTIPTKVRFKDVFPERAKQIVDKFLGANDDANDVGTNDVAAWKIASRGLIMQRKKFLRRDVNKLVAAFFDAGIMEYPILHPDEAPKIAAVNNVHLGSLYRHAYTRLCISHQLNDYLKLVASILVRGYTEFGRPILDPEYRGYLTSIFIKLAIVLTGIDIKPDQIHVDDKGGMHAGPIWLCPGGGDWGFGHPSFVIGGILVDPQVDPQRRGILERPQMLDPDQSGYCFDVIPRGDLGMHFE